MSKERMNVSVSKPTERCKYMNRETTEKILECLIYGCYMLTDECNPSLVDAAKSAKDVEEWQRRAVRKYQGWRGSRGVTESNLFHSVIENMLANICHLTTGDVTNDVQDSIFRTEKQGVLEED